MHFLRDLNPEDCQNIQLKENRSDTDLLKRKTDEGSEAMRDLDFDLHIIQPVNMRCSMIWYLISDSNQTFLIP